MKNPEFTKEASISYQQRDLQIWKTVLTAMAYEALKAWAEETNESTIDPYEIRRGAELSTFVHNYAHKTEESKSKLIDALESVSETLKSLNQFPERDGMMYAIYTALTN